MQQSVRRFLGSEKQPSRASRPGAAATEADHRPSSRLVQVGSLLVCLCLD